jgi:hypothetical protein
MFFTRPLRAGDGIYHYRLINNNWSHDWPNRQFLQHTKGDPLFSIPRALFVLVVDTSILNDSRYKSTELNASFAVINLFAELTVKMTGMVDDDFDRASVSSNAIAGQGLFNASGMIKISIAREDKNITGTDAAHMQFNRMRGGNDADQQRRSCAQCTK